MIYWKLFIACLLTSSIISINYASSFTMEEIVGGYIAPQSEFKYQAAIIGKYNYSYVSNFLCSAAILSNTLLLSAAKCFLHTAYEMRKLRFFATVGVNTLITKDLILHPVAQIYTYHFSTMTDNNLAVAKLIYSLELERRPDLAFLHIPLTIEVFNGRTGVVSGFGINTIDNIIANQNREQIRITPTKSLNLTYANVTIINEQRELYERSPYGEFICGTLSRYFHELCGMMVSDTMYPQRGVCMGDLGAPLVIDNKVVGVVSKRRRNCDDTHIGAVYTKVTKYEQFILELKRGRILENTIIYNNPGHIGNWKLRPKSDRGSINY